MSMKSDAGRSGKMEPHMDPAALYREEVFSDRAAGAVRRLTPVRADGSPDPARKTIYVGEAQLLTSVGSLPLSFEIEAPSLEAAVAKYGECVKQAYEQAVEEFQELRRRASSSLVIPESGAAGLGAGLGPGGLPGGGKLTLP